MNPKFNIYEDLDLWQLAAKDEGIKKIISGYFKDLDVINKDDKRFFIIGL